MKAIKIIFTLFLISILYFIVVYFRWTFSHKEKGIKYYMTDLRLNYFLACLFLAIITIMICAFWGIDSVNYFFGLKWLIN